jgi:hypothetical protein
MFVKCYTPIFVKCFSSKLVKLIHHELTYFGQTNNFLDHYFSVQLTTKRSFKEDSTVSLIDNLSKEGSNYI